MAVDADTLLFFDASCLIVATGSPTGGSGFLTTLCQRHFLEGAVSSPVLTEARRNVREKLSAEALERYFRLVVLTPFRLVPVPPPRVLADCASLVGPKDAHVLAAALAVYLLMLDKKLAERINGADSDVQAISPGDFIKTVLPRRPDYRSFRA